MSTILNYLKEIFYNIDDLYFKYLEDKPKGYTDEITLGIAEALSMLSDLIDIGEKNGNTDNAN